MEKSLHSNLTAAGVEHNILPIDYLKSSLYSTNSDSDEEVITEEKYNLFTRSSADQLTKDFAIKVKEAQNNYKENLQFCKDRYFLNIGAARTMDSKFKEADDYYINSTPFDETNNHSVDNIDVVTKYDNRKICPILGCNKTVHKLKRHLEAIHPRLKISSMNYALKMGNILFKNKFPPLKPSDPSPKVVKQVKRHTVTKLISRKNNYKKCALCESLVINISDHIKNKHNIPNSNADYMRYISDSKVVPSCYIKMINNKPFLLQGDELECAKRNNEDEIKKQTQKQKALMKLRAEIQSIQQEINVEKNDAKLKMLRDKLCNIKEEFKKIRYKNEYNLPTNIKSWQDAFIMTLKDQKYTDAERRGTIAIEVLRPYLATTKNNVTLEDILNGETVRTMLNLYLSVNDISSASLVKYLQIFKSFISFIASNSLSPERKETTSNSEIIARRIKVDDVHLQIVSITNGLKKDIPTEQATKRSKENKRLLSDDEKDKFFDEADLTIAKFLQDSRNEQLHTYNWKQINNVRDTLMAIGTIRLARRSLEIMSFTIEEMEQAVMDVIDDVTYYTVNVSRHKGRKNGTDAYISWTEPEYQALKIYVEFLRPLLSTDNKYTSCVFTVRSRENSTTCNSMSFSNVYRILQRFQTTSGKKFSTRIIRKSTVTNAVRNYSTDAHRHHLAKTMSHNVATANVHYDQHATKESVLHCLSACNKDRAVRKKLPDSNTSSTSIVISQSTPSVIEQSTNSFMTLSENSFTAPPSSSSRSPLGSLSMAPPSSLSKAPSRNSLLTQLSSSNKATPHTNTLVQPSSSSRARSDRSLLTQPSLSSRTPSESSSLAPTTSSSKAPSSISSLTPSSSSSRSELGSSTMAPSTTCSKAHSQNSFLAPPSNSSKAPSRNSFLAPPSNSSKAPSRNSFLAPPSNSSKAPSRNSFLAPPLSSCKATLGNSFQALPSSLSQTTLGSSFTAPSTSCSTQLSGSSFLSPPRRPSKEDSCGSSLAPPTSTSKPPSRRSFLVPSIKKVLKRKMNPEATSTPDRSSKCNQSDVGDESCLNSTVKQSSESSSITLDDINFTISSTDLSVSQCISDQIFKPNSFDEEENMEYLFSNPNSVNLKHTDRKHNIAAVEKNASFPLNFNCMPADETLLNLRSKKIKTSHDKENMLKAEIISIVEKLKLDGKIDNLYTKNGHISVSAITESLSPDIRNSFCVKAIRSMLKSILEPTTSK